MSTTTQSATPSTTFSDRDCHNKQSIHHSAPNAPRCLNHPTGTLKYQWHTAYDHLLQGTANKKNIHPVLLGLHTFPTYDKMNHVFNVWLDERRATWLDLDLDSDEASTPMDEFKQDLILYIGKVRKDLNWQAADDQQYIDLALDTYIRDTYHWWMKRGEQKNAAESQQDDTAAVVQPTSRPTSAVGSARKRRRVTSQNDDDASESGSRRGAGNIIATPMSSTNEGATMSTAIDVDMEDTPSAAASGRNVLRRLNEEDRDRLAAIRERSGKVAVARTPVITSSPPARVAAPPAANEEDTTTNENDQSAELERLRSENEQLLRDNAALGLALAENSGIRRNSAAAVRDDMPKRTTLVRSVAERLMGNEGFTERWFNDEK